MSNEETLAESDPRFSTALALAQDVLQIQSFAGDGWRYRSRRGTIAKIIPVVCTTDLFGRPVPAEKQVMQIKYVANPSL